MSSFEDDLRRELEDPELAKLYAAETAGVEAEQLERLEAIRHARLPGGLTFMPGSKAAVLDMLGPDVKKRLENRHGMSFDVDIQDGRER